MIIDRLDNSLLYYGMSKEIQAALQYLADTDFTNMPCGKYDFGQHGTFFIVSEYETKPREDVLYEAHRQYIDIQYIVCGVEYIGYQYIGALKEEIPYDNHKDIIFYTGEGNLVQVGKNNFVILFPDDAHKPCVSVDKIEKVKKVVFKILV